MENKYIVRFGGKAYLYTLPVVLILFGLTFLFLYIDFVLFLGVFFIDCLVLFILVYYFYSFRLTVRGSLVDVHFPFQKGVFTFDISGMTFIKSKLSNTATVKTEQGEFRVYFYMTNVKRFLSEIHKDE